MSRFKRFTHSLLSGYLLLGANIVYTIVSIPLALHYLTTKEFSLWILTSQIAGYLALVDMGMGSSVARILIDHKDERGNGRYGGVLKTALLVGAAQGAIVLAAGLVLVWFLGDWLGISMNLSEKFFWLMTGQIILAAASFVSRIFSQVLFAWQRVDIQNYALVLQFVVWLAGLWIGFALGMGVYSLLLSLAAGWICVTVICAVACRWLGFWPRRGEWGKISKGQFNEVFSYAADVFLITVGTQLILCSQVVLVTRAVSEEAATIWAVMTKAFTFVTQVLTRIISATMPALAEMQARKEDARLWERFRGLFMVVNVLGAACAVLFAACNSPFVSVWTGGRISWPFINDVLLAAWLLVLVQQCCYNSLIISLKEIRELKYTYLVEGAVFVVASALALPRFGMTGMLVCSLACTLAFTWANGLWRTAKLAHARNQPSLWRWQWPLARVALVMLPCWAATDWLTRDGSLWLRLVVNGVVLGAAGCWAALRFALPRQLTAELVGKLPQPAQRCAAVFLP